MERRGVVEELIAFSRYLSWADLVRRAYEAECHKSGDGVAGEPVWGPDFAWLSYWYGSLFVVVEAYEAINWRDRIVDDLLAHPGGYKGLLRRFRNGVFHFQRDSTDSRLLELLNKGEEHVLWVHALHHEFRRLLRDRISAVAATSHVRAEIEATLQHLLDWLPDEPEIREFDRTVDRARDIVWREPIPGLEERHAQIGPDLNDMAGIRSTYEANRERLRRELLSRLGITVADGAGG